jgi:hypothetical protein
VVKTTQNHPFLKVFVDNTLPKKQKLYTTISVNLVPVGKGVAGSIYKMPTKL